MARKHIFSLFLLIVFSGNNFAGDASNVHQDYSEIEAAERQYIIEELTYRLETEKICKQIQKWSDEGSGADKDGYFFIPSIKSNSFMIGGYGTQNRKKSNCVLTVSEPQNNPENTPALLMVPVDWKLIWTDKGSGALGDGSMWKAIPPDSNYKCIGSIPQSGYEKPVLSGYRCVHASLTEKIVTDSVIWSDRGSNADKQVTMFRLPHTKSFIAVKGRKEQIETYDLKANPQSTPDPKLVEEKLAARMEIIRQDLGTKLQEEAEQKHLAEEAEQKRLAEEAERKRLAEEAEKMRLAEEAEQERLVEEEVKMRLAEEAEQERQAEEEVNMRLAKEAEQERLAEEEVKMRLAEEAEQERLAEAAEQERLAEEAEQERLAEETEQEAQPEDLDKTEAAVTRNENTIPDTDDKKSTGINSFYLFLLKVFTLAVGLPILLLIVFRVIYKKIKK